MHQSEHVELKEASSARISAELEKIVQTMLAKKPEER